MTPFLQRQIRRISVGALALAAASPGDAASCVIAPQGVSFGNYDPFSGSDLEAVGNIRLECDAVVGVTTSLSPGAGSYSARQMSNATSNLAYNLFTSSQRIAVWGDGSGGSDTVSATVQAADFPVYGTIPARQNVTTGTYQDTVIITVTY